MTNDMEPNEEKVIFGIIRTSKEIRTIPKADVRGREDKYAELPTMYPFFERMCFAEIYKKNKR